MYAIDGVRRVVRSWLKQVAKFLDQISRGNLAPHHITYLSLAAHVLVAWAIIEGQLLWAAGGLAVFGLMDALDGELARLQGRESVIGIVLDATSDRIKETMIYAAITVYLAGIYGPATLFWVVLALGASISLSFVKAKGEAVLASQKDVEIDPHALNKFTGGSVLMQFDVRMAVIVIGLLADQLLAASVVIALASLFGVISRYSELKHLLEK